jgi:hypothetical protein
MKKENSLLLPNVAAPTLFIKIMATLLLCICISTRTQAQEIFSQPQAKLISVFHFEQLTGGVILLRGTLNNTKDSLNFILDTGSGGISLDSAVVSILKLPITHSDRIIRGIAGIRQVDYTMHNTLHLPGLQIDSLDFHINDYSLLTGVYGIPIDGIIGYSVLRRYIVNIDYNLHQLSFFTPGTYRYPRGGTVLRPAFNNLPIQPATIKEARQMRQRFYLDTGGGLCLLLSEDFVQDSLLFTKKKKMLPTITEGLGGKKTMMITTVREFKLGPYRFKRVPTYVFDDEYNVTSYPTLGGLLGADILRRFNITLNYPRAEIHLLPNTHFRDPFDYSYTGMEVFFEEGNAVIAAIMKDSPAEKCGLQVGDVIFAIDNVVGISFQNIKSLLQGAERRIKIIVMRNKIPVEIKMKTGTIN